MRLLQCRASRSNSSTNPLIVNFTAVQFHPVGRGLCFRFPFIVNTLPHPVVILFETSTFSSIIAYATTRVPDFKTFVDCCDSSLFLTVSSDLKLFLQNSVWNPCTTLIDAAIVWWWLVLGSKHISAQCLDNNPSSLRRLEATLMANRPHHRPAMHLPQVHQRPMLEQPCRIRTSIKS